MQLTFAKVSQGAPGVFGFQIDISVLVRDTYFEALELLAELIGLHPRRCTDPDYAAMLRKAGWRPFYCDRVGGR